jgi:hypothetical protein
MTDIPELSAAEIKARKHIALLDASTSMTKESHKMAPESRWKEQEEYVEGFLRELAKEGCDLDIIVYASSVKTFKGIKSSREVEQIFQEIKPSGSTNMAAALEEAEKLRGGKPAIIHTWTDGVPDNKEAVERAIATAGTRIKEDAELAFSFVQVGNDRDATTWLESLDDGLKDKYPQLKHDIVNCITYEAAQQLTPGQIMYLAVND